MGHGVAPLAPVCPVVPGTDVCRVCSVWPSGTVPMAGGLQPWGALAGPTQMLVVPVQEHGHCGGVPHARSALCQLTTATRCGWLKGCPTLPGCSTRAQGATHTCVPTMPRASWHLLALQQPGTAPAALRGDGNSQNQFITNSVKPVLLPSPSGYWALPSERQKAESPWFEQGW